MKKPKKYRNSRNKSPKFKTTAGKTYRGVISINSREVGYVAIEGFKEDIEIQPHFLRTAMHRDEVEVALLSKEKNRRVQGEVISVVKRAKESFVGVLEKSNGFFFLKPDDKKMYRDIFVRGDVKPETVGKKALVKITTWKEPKKNPEGEVIRILGEKGKHNVEMESIILEKGFESGFPSESEKEAEALAKQYKSGKFFEEEVKKRRDFRDRVCFTIDPKTAKDFDDALSVIEIRNPKHEIQNNPPAGGQNSNSKEQKIYEIGIHIADVAFFVREKTALDEEAKKRGFSVYLVDRTIPMLPEILSNDLCSLNPNEDKFAFSAVFKMKASGEVIDSWFGKTVIRSKKRFAYENAQKILDAENGEFFNELNILNQIAKKLREAKFKEGAIDFETDEVQFELDENGVPVKIYKKERLETHKLVEEFMLLANRKVAEHIYNEGKKAGIKNKKPEISIYRIHDVPDKEKIADLSIFLRALGYELNLNKGNITSKDINALLKKIEGKAHESLVKTAALRSMSKAVYSTKNIGHFGLAFQYYTHFTSPIRRYPDLLVHRILEKNISGKKLDSNQFAKYESIAKEASSKEVSAAEAERASIKYKQVEYMKNHVGETFDAVVSGVTDWGIYVEEINTKSEGMIRLSEMSGDYYLLDKKNYAIIGEKTKKKYTLGDKVKVKLKNADLDAKTLDFVFV